MMPKSEDNRYKIRIEMGWGNNEQELFMEGKDQSIRRTNFRSRALFPRQKRSGSRVLPRTYPRII